MTLNHVTYRAGHLGILKSLADEITTFARDMCVLAALRLNKPLLLNALTYLFPEDHLQNVSV
jgi:hypothetical protein